MRIKETDRIELFSWQLPVRKLHLSTLNNNTPI